MKRILFIFAIIGSVCALQYPMEYHYLYQGRLATGIPGIRPQVTALGIKARLVLQIKTKSQGLVKLTDVQVGEFNGDLQCVELRQPVPFSWSPIPQYKEQIEQPFAVSFQEELDDVMKVHQSDVEFITNIRKSIIEMVRLEPVVANLGGIKGDRLAGYVTEGNAPQAFSMEEETIFGRCESEYTLTRLPEYIVQVEKEEIAKHLKKDDQAEGSARSGGASVPKLGETYYRLIRAVNFDKCNDRVILQHAGTANMSRAGYAQFRAVQSRSSVGTYILKGHPGGFRVERAIVEGDVIANPFGFKTHRLQTITNQTLVLESAQAIQTTIRLPSATRNVKTWRYEVASPFSAPEGHPKPWVNYYNKGDKHHPVYHQSTLLGLMPTPSVIQEYKNNFLDMIKVVVRDIYSEPSAPSPNLSGQSTRSSVSITQLHLMTRIMRALPIKEVREIFSQVYAERDTIGQRKQMILCDVAAASGAGAPIAVLLDTMKKGEISPQRIGSIFMTIPNNLYAPCVIPDLVKYAKTVDIERNPVLASTVLVNVASLLERVCLNPKKFNYTVPNPLFGAEVCKSSIIENLLPYLKQKAQDANKSWERAIVIQAIVNLGTPQILPVLRPHIYGHLDSNPRVRTVAIYGLSKKRMPDSAREVVFDTLMDVVDSLGEEPEIRQAAFSALLTWHPDTAWWQRMARMTWREPSQSMAAFITFTIESLAKATEPYLHRQSEIAAFVLPLLKPFSPSQKYSYNYIYSRYDTTSKIGINGEIAYIHALRSVIPSEIYTSLRGNFGGLHLDLFEVAIASEGLSQNVSDFISYFETPSFEGGQYTPPSSKDSSIRYMKEVMTQMKKHVGTERSYKGHTEANIYLRAFDNLCQYLPINSDVIAKIAGEGGSTFLEKLLHGHTMNITKFYNPLELEYFLPTEIGLPLIGSVVMPTMNLGDVEAQLLVSDVSKPTIHNLLKARNVTLLLKTNYKYVSKLIVKMQVPVPWNQKFIESGIENMQEINLPIYGNLTFNHTSEVKNLTINIAPFTEQKFPVVYAHNIPFTQIRGVIPSREQHSDYKIIAVQKDRSPILKIEREYERKYTGLSVELNYKSDAPHPFTSAYLADYMLKPENFGKLLASPTAKQWQFSLNMKPESASRNISIALAYLTPHSGSGGSSSIPDFTPEDSVAQRMEKLRRFSEGSQVYGVSAQLFFNGSEFRKYEALLAFTHKSQNQETKECKALLAVMTGPIPGYIESPKVVCSQAQFTSPAITDFNSLKQAVQSQLRDAVHGQIHHGRSCASSSVASFVGSMTVSSERQREIQEELNKVCTYDHANPVVELQTAAVYDQGHLEVEFSEAKIPQTLQNLTYSVQDCIEGYLHPHGYYNRMHTGSPNKIIVDANRPLSHEGYIISADLPRKYAIFTDIRVPYSVTRIVPFLGLKTSFSKYSNFVIAPEMPDTCQIQSSKIITYDGVNYQYTPLPCWTTAAIDSTKPDDFIVHTRKTTSGAFEAQILIPNDNAIVEFSRSKAVINGTPMPPSESKHVVKNKAGQVIMEVIKHSGYYEVVVTGKLSVVVKDEIQIVPQPTMKGVLRGVCGDFDGETTYDKTGPKNCLYNNTDLFEYAWTIPEGDGCNKGEVSSMQQQVQHFQEHCPKRPSGGTSHFDVRSVYESKLVNCYQHVYPVRKSGPAWCVTEEPVQICAEGCTMHGKTIVKKLAKCWLDRNVPAEVKQAESIGYLTHPSTEPAKFRDQIPVVSATDCRSK